MKSEQREREWEGNGMEVRRCLRAQPFRKRFILQETREGEGARGSRLRPLVCMQMPARKIFIAGITNRACVVTVGGFTRPGLPLR